MIDRNIREDRDAYVLHARSFWQKLASGGPVEEANAETDRGNEIVNYWVAAGRIRELVEPLLASDEVELRYAAAADLIRHSPTDEAWKVMIAIREERSYGLISSTATLFLMENQR